MADDNTIPPNTIDPNNPPAAKPFFQSPFATPEQIAQQRAYATSLQQNAMKMPVHRWTQGVAQMVNALMGGMAQKQADEQQRQLATQGYQNRMDALQGAGLGGGGAPQNSVPTQGATGDTSSPQSAAPSSSGSSVYNDLKNQGATDNEAAVLAGNAGAESSYNPGAIHDGGKGYGLYGHETDRLAAMQQQTGSAKPGMHDQNTFALQELRSRPESKMVNEAQTPEQLATAGMFFERPKGFTPDNPQGGSNYSGRLANIAGFMNQGKTAAAPAAAPLAYADPGATLAPAVAAIAAHQNPPAAAVPPPEARMLTPPVAPGAAQIPVGTVPPHAMQDLTANAGDVLNPDINKAFTPPASLGTVNPAPQAAGQNLGPASGVAMMQPSSAQVAGGPSAPALRAGVAALAAQARPQQIQGAPPPVAPSVSPAMIAALQGARGSNLAAMQPNPTIPSQGGSTLPQGGNSPLAQAGPPAVSGGPIPPQMQAQMQGQTPQGRQGINMEAISRFLSTPGVSEADQNLVRNLITPQLVGGPAGSTSLQSAAGALTGQPNTPWANPGVGSHTSIGGNDISSQTYYDPQSNSIKTVPQVPGTNTPISGGSVSSTTGDNVLGPGTPLNELDRQASIMAARKADALARGTGAGEANLAANATIKQTQNQIQNLNSALGALKSYTSSGGQMPTGELAQHIREIQNVATELHLGAFNPEDVAGMEVFNKNAQRYINESTQNIPGLHNTNMVLEGATTAAPNEKLTNLGNRDVIDSLVRTLKLKQKYEQGFADMPPGSSMSDYNKKWVQDIQSSPTILSRVGFDQGKRADGTLVQKFPSTAGRGWTWADPKHIDDDQ